MTGRVHNGDMLFAMPEAEHKHAWKILFAVFFEIFCFRKVIQLFWDFLFITTKSL